MRYTSICQLCSSFKSHLKSATAQINFKYAKTLRNYKTRYQNNSYYNYNYFYSQKIIILRRKSWQTASNVSLRSASGRNTINIRIPVTLLPHETPSQSAAHMQTMLSVSVTAQPRFLGVRRLPSHSCLRGVTRRDTFFLRFCALRFSHVSAWPAPGNWSPVTKEEGQESGGRSGRVARRSPVSQVEKKNVVPRRHLCLAS